MKPRTPPSELRAFRVTVPGWEEVTSIHLTTHAGKARFASWRSAHEVGYRLTFGQLLVRRAPEFDALQPTEAIRRGISEDHARHLLELLPQKPTRKELLARIEGALAAINGHRPQTERLVLAREALEGKQP